MYFCKRVLWKGSCTKTKECIKLKGISLNNGGNYTQRKKPSLLFGKGVRGYKIKSSRAFSLPFLKEMNEQLTLHLKKPV